MIHGPRTRSSPGSPGRTSALRSSALAMRTSTPGKGRPALVMFPKSASGLFERSSYFATRLPTLPSGFVSVMPQPCRNSTLRFSPYQRIISGGGAEPPQVSRRNRCFCRTASKPIFSMAPRTPCHTVGTPVLSSTCQSSIRFKRDSGSMNRPVKTMRVPSMRPMKGTPQLNTWNIGTKGHTVIDPEIPSWSGAIPLSVWRYVDRWL
mmetsp:Transcript_75504/g.209789  ORF Transcript_75504/g.209789 Transcript_75504/m.209789 type:complete len:206 (-) Transcript_75504:738-1355(-)